MPELKLPDCPHKLSKLVVKLGTRQRDASAKLARIRHNCDQKNDHVWEDGGYLAKCQKCGTVKKS
jgi:hypothetical protein